MEEITDGPDLSRLDFNDDRTYAFLKINDKNEYRKKYKIFNDEARKRGVEKLFNEKVKVLGEATKPQSMYEVNSKGTPLKIWENLKVLYDSKEIELRYNELKRTIESNHTWYMYEDFLTQVNSDCRRNRANTF